MPKKLAQKKTKSVTNAEVRSVRSEYEAIIRDRVTERAFCSLLSNPNTFNLHHIEKLPDLVKNLQKYAEQISEIYLEGVKR